MLKCCWYGTLPWQSSGQDSVLPMQGMHVRSLVEEVGFCKLRAVAKTTTTKTASAHFPRVIIGTASASSDPILVLRAHHPVSLHFASRLVPMAFFTRRPRTTGAA